MNKRLLALMVALSAIGLMADVPTIEVNKGITQQGDVAWAHCGGGQSSATVYVPATTGPGPTPTAVPATTGPTATPGPTSTPIVFGGTVTVYTAADVRGAPGPTNAPFSILPGHSLTYTQATSAPGYLYVALNSDQWVAAVYTSPSPASTGNLPGPRALITITCSGAVFPFPVST